MRVNVYAEELTDRVEIIAKEIEGQTFTGVRFYLELPATVNGWQHQGPFIHRPGDDDSSAVTFWGKRDLRILLRKALALLEQHGGYRMTHPIDAPQADSVTKLAEKAAREIVRQFFGTPDAEKYYQTTDIVPIIAAAIRSGIEGAEKGSEHPGWCADALQRAESAEARVTEQDKEALAITEQMGKLGKELLDTEEQLSSAQTRIDALEGALRDVIQLCEVWGIAHQKQVTDARQVLAPQPQASGGEGDK